MIEMGINAKSNITNSKLVDLSLKDFEPGGGFFIRSNVGGVIKYCPTGNTDEQAITKTIVASAIFIDPEYCRKIFKEGTTASQIYIGYGV